MTEENKNEQLNTQTDYDALLQKYAHGHEKSRSMLPWFALAGICVFSLGVFWIIFMAMSSSVSIDNRTKLRITKEEAKELKEFLEESNVEQLREKVKELQQIKKIMVGLRNKYVEALGEAEKDTHENLPEDFAMNFKELTALISEASNNLKNAEKLFPAMFNDLYSVGDLIKNYEYIKAKPGLEKFQKAKLAFYKDFYAARDIEEKFIFFSTRVKELTEWTGNPAIRADWDTFEKMQLAVKKKTDEFYNKDYGLHRQMSEAAKTSAELIKDGATYEAKIKDIHTKEKQQQEKFGAEKIQVAKLLEEKKKVVSDLGQHLKDYKKKENALKNEEKGLNNKYRRMPSKNDEQKLAKAEAKKLIDAKNIEIKTAETKRRELKSKQRTAKKELGEIEKKHRYLKAPQRAREDHDYLRRNIYAKNNWMYDSVRQIKTTKDKKGNETTTILGPTPRFKKCQEILQQAAAQQRQALETLQKIQTRIMTYAESKKEVYDPVFPNSSAALQSNKGDTAK